MNAENITLELCCDNLYSVEVACDTRLDRIELCAALSEGGLTPSYGLVAAAKRFPGEIMAMIRPRKGDFVYTDAEFDAMKTDIRIMKSLDIEGFVLGILTPSGSVDVKRTKELVELAKPFNVCFHRAIDETKYLIESVEDVISCGCCRILTSGGCNSAPEGVQNLRLMMQQSAGRIEIMAGSGVSHRTVGEIFAGSGVTNYHFSASKRKYDITDADKDEVLAIRNALKTL
ncbi:MAG: copper homeostasis protein CutC [Bacteroidales bacterium]|jgi:copper homeostasis protein|nr:copper homeostasis protein CutC [Bacteroidales bacterium]